MEPWQGYFLITLSVIRANVANTQRGRKSPLEACVTSLWQVTCHRQLSNRMIRRRSVDVTEAKRGKARHEVGQFSFVKEHCLSRDTIHFLTLHIPPLPQRRQLPPAVYLPKARDQRILVQFVPGIILELPPVRLIRLSPAPLLGYVSVHKHPSASG